MKKTNATIINHEEKTITITKDFAKRANIINSDEYSALAQFRKDYPDYTIQKRTAAKNTNKNTHSGLTLAYMGRFIEMQDNAAAALEAFERVKYLNEGHPAYYAKVKAWFLAKYPDYADFNPDIPAPAQNTDVTPINTAA